MSSFIRSAKSGGDWSRNELLAYNIVVQHQDATRFFGRSLQRDRFLAYLDLADLASRPKFWTKKVLSMTLREVPSKSPVLMNAATALLTRYDFPFTICGDPHRTARADLCLVHLNSVILLVVQATSDGSDSEPQVIAKAIAAFEHNNQKRAERNLPDLDDPMYCYVWNEANVLQGPSYHTQLSESVVSGQYPLEPTVVTRCSPPTRRRAFEGIEIPDYRHNALQYYDAFRDLAKACWAESIGRYKVCHEGIEPEHLIPHLR